MSAGESGHYGGQCRGRHFLVAAESFDFMDLPTDVRRNAASPRAVTAAIFHFCRAMCVTAVSA